MARGRQTGGERPELPRPSALRGQRRAEVKALLDRVRGEIEAAYSAPRPPVSREAELAAAPSIVRVAAEVVGYGPLWSLLRRLDGYERNDLATQRMRQPWSESVVRARSKLEAFLFATEDLVNTDGLAETELGLVYDLVNAERMARSMSGWMIVRFTPEHGRRPPTETTSRRRAVARELRQRLPTAEWPWRRIAELILASDSLPDPPCPRFTERYHRAGELGLQRLEERLRQLVRDRDQVH